MIHLCHSATCHVHAASWATPPDGRMSPLSLSLSVCGEARSKVSRRHCSVRRTTPRPVCVSRFYAGGSWNEGTSKVPLSVQSRFMLACHFSACAPCVSAPPVYACRSATTTHVHGYTRVRNRVGPPLPSNWPWYIVPPDIGSYKFHRGFQRGCNRSSRPGSSDDVSALAGPLLPYKAIPEFLCLLFSFGFSLFLVFYILEFFSASQTYSYTWIRNEWKS